MADLRIVDAPLLSTVKGTEKIPTGGEGNFSVSVNQVADFAKLKWFLATEEYVDNAVGNVQADLNLHKNNSSNPHGVTKLQVGLGNVDNTADLDKPLSNATQSAIITANSGKADKSYVDSQDQLKADKVDLTASKILSDSGQIQQVINDFGGARWYEKSGGYGLGATVKLSNGDIVKSTVANNIVDPNVAMTGWVKTNDASQIIDVSGNTQQEINDSIAVKLLKASEIGLVKWDQQYQPPYTTQHYDQAYNNGINLAAAVMQANADGYSEVVIERGLYPLCYSNLSGSTAINQSANCKITGTTNLTIDFNGSTFFTIFDSNNRSPYDKSTGLLPYQLSGSAIEIQGNTNLELTKFKIVGDQWFRSWVTNEQNTEQTYGIIMRDDNLNTRITKFDINGFRGDGISGNTRGTVVISTLVDNWSSGGVDATGAEIVLAGSYRSPLIDLSSFAIKRNSIQIMSAGYTRSASFRNDVLDVYFYDSSGAFIIKENARHCEFIYLPKGCRYVRLVANSDERTDAVVGYGASLWLVSGTSLLSYLEGSLHDNHRGGVSNLCGYTTISCDIYDIGSTKNGFKVYNNSTRYGINFEDLFVSKLTVKGTNIANCPQGVLVNSRDFEMVGGTLRDIQYAAIAVYGTVASNVSNVKIDNCKTTVFWADEVAALGKYRSHSFNNCTIKNSTMVAKFASSANLLLSSTDSKLLNSSVNIEGNGENVIFDNNIVVPVTGRYFPVFSIKSALSCKGNYVSRSSNVNADSIGWGEITVGAKSAYGNIVSIEQAGQRFRSPRSSTETRKITGVTFDLVSSSNDFELLNIVKAGDFSNFTDVIPFDNVKFNSGILRLGDLLSRTGTLCDTTIEFNDCEFNNTQIHISRKATVYSGITSITFKDCLFDITSITRFLYVPYLLSGSLSITIINCTITSDTLKSLAVFQGESTNVTVWAIGCKFVNVTNTDAILNINGTIKVTYDPPSLTTGTQQSTTVTLTGSAIGNNVSCSFSQPLQGTRMWAEVTSANTVTVYHRNDTGSTVDLASGTLTVKLI